MSARSRSAWLPSIFLLFFMLSVLCLYRGFVERRGGWQIAGMGGVTKDLGLGLVDFPHVRDGRVVNLCWKFGERAVGYWHGLDEGYANRRPL